MRMPHKNTVAVPDPSGYEVGEGESFLPAGMSIQEVTVSFWEARCIPGCSEGISICVHLPWLWVPCVFSP